MIAPAGYCLSVSSKATFQAVDRVRQCLSPVFCSLLVVFVSCLAAPLSALAAVRTVAIIPSEQAREHIGETNMVCGLVAGARFLESAEGQPTFLNFDRPYPNQTFTARILGSSRAGFSGPPEVLFKGKNVCATGVIANNRGRPEIVVEDPSQVILEEATPTPASEPVTNTSARTPAPTTAVIAEPVTNTIQITPIIAVEPVTNTIQKVPALPAPAPAPQGVPSAQAKQHIGEITMVCGVVVGAKYLESHGAGRTFLNFDQPYPNQTFSVVIEGPNRGKFPSAPEALFQGKTVCVAGKIVDNRGRPQIVVENPSQIVVQR